MTQTTWNTAPPVRKRHVATRRSGSCSVRWAIGYAGIGVTRITQWLPLGAARRLGKALGLLVYYVVPRLHHRGMDNLNQAYGDSLSRREKTRILKQTASNMGIVTAEFGRIPFIDTEFVRNHITVEGLEHIDRSRGAVFIAAHYGNWEWLGPVLRTADLPVVEIVRPPTHPALDAVVDAIRQSNGVITLRRGEAGLKLVRMLRQGYMVGILIDQNPKTAAAPVTFFGRPCWATAAPVMAALRARVPLHGIRAVRAAAGRYDFEITPPISLEHTKDFRQSVVVNVQRCQDLIEQWVREHPAHWMWFHRRWRPRPALTCKWDARNSD
ncbi:MAG: lysophospholipid acyltransferase family protein [Candidatus Hydrogenedentota bacterium]